MTLFTVKTICCLSIGSFVIFSLIQVISGVSVPHLWIDLKVTNNNVMTALTGSLIMFQYPLSLILLYTMILLRFVSCIFPIRGPLQRSMCSYIQDVVKTVLSLTMVIGALVFLVFGTAID